jgi:hypothetical protein
MRKHLALLALATFVHAGAWAATYTFTGPIYASPLDYTAPCSAGTCANAPPADNNPKSKHPPSTPYFMTPNMLHVGPGNKRQPPGPLVALTTYSTTARPLVCAGNSTAIG